jgi:hypothetical protein
MKKVISEVENSLIAEPVSKGEKKHIGNLKLSESKKAIKGHIFATELFFVISLSEIQGNKVGKIYQYISGQPEIIGEILPPTNKNKPMYQVNIDHEIYYIKPSYIQMFQNGSNLTLGIFEE